MEYKSISKMELYQLIEKKQKHLKRWLFVYIVKHRIREVINDARRKRIEQ